MMKNAKDLLMAAVICGSLGLLTVACAAENDSNSASLAEFNLDQIVVTATRTEKTILETPANTQVIMAKELKEKGFNNAFQAVTNLSQSGSMAWQEDGGDYGGMMSRIRIRGVDNGTLVLVDGLPTNFGNASALNNIPVDQIEKIEFVKGAGSVLYGPQAMGGVVNVITKRPKRDSQTSGNVYGSYGNRYKDAGINVQTNRFVVGLKQSFTADHIDILHPGTTGIGASLDIKDKSSEQLFANIRITDDLTATLSRTNNKQTFYSGNFVDYKIVPNQVGKLKTGHNTYGLIYDNIDDGWKAAVSYVNMHIDGDYGDAFLNNLYKGYNLNFDLQKKFSFRQKKDSLVVGIAINREYWKVVSPRYKVDEDNARNNYSLYESYERKVTDKLSLIFGLREYWMTKSKYQTSDFQILPQFQGLYKLNDKSSLYFNVGKSFEMPTLSTGFYKYNNYVLNPNLKPQSSWTHEFGYKYDNGKTALTTTIFYLTARDKISWGKTDKGENILQNCDKWRNLGYELNVTQKLNNVQDIYAGITYQNPQSKSDTGNSWKQDEAKVILNLGTTYHKSKFTGDLRLFSYMKREQAYYPYTKENPNPGKNIYPDHNLENSFDLTATLTYKPTSQDTFRLVGRNLLNREDVINYNEYYATPANFYVTYERAF